MINKKVSPKGKTVRVTFELPAEVAQERVAVVGDFNDWDEEKHTMKFDKKNGVWKRSVSLRPGNKYQFRYLVDGHDWRNEEEADGYAPNPYLGENSILTV